MKSRLSLTPREIEQLHWFSKGLKNKQVAKQMGVKPGTVKSRNEKIFIKLDVKNMTEAVAVAYEIGTLPLL